MANTETPKVNFIAGTCSKTSLDEKDTATMAKIAAQVSTMEADGIIPIVGINRDMSDAATGANKELLENSGTIFVGGKPVGTTKADELILQADIPVTGVTVGNYGNGTTIKAGTTIEAILKSMLMKTIGVTKTDPTVSLSGITSQTVEYGDTIPANITEEHPTITLTLTLNDGKYSGQSGYSYNLAMGCTMSAATIAGVAAKVADTKKTATYSYSHEAITSAVTISSSATISAAANIPVNNMGAQIKDGLYTGGVKSAANVTITPQLKWWVGFSNTKESDMTWDSAGVRALNKASNYITTKSVDVTFPAGAKQQVIAVPSGRTFSAKDAAGADITATYVKQAKACSVECGTGKVAQNYDIYVAPANAGLAADSKATITLNN